MATAGYYYYDSTACSTTTITSVTSDATTAATTSAIEYVAREASYGNYPGSAVVNHHLEGNRVISGHYTRRVADPPEPQIVPMTEASSTTYTTYSTSTIEITYQVVIDEWAAMSQQRHLSEEEQQAVDEEQKKKKEEQELALKKSKALLEFLLDDNQKKEFQKSGSFCVPVGDRTFRIRKGRAGNIDELDKEGKKIASLCVHEVEQVPVYDTMAGQLLFLRHDPEELIKTANITRY